jgi:alpha-tubulin suppressor-like RCC1 family protein
MKLLFMNKYAKKVIMKKVSIFTFMTSFLLAFSISVCLSTEGAEPKQKKKVPSKPQSSAGMKLPQAAAPQKTSPAISVSDRFTDNGDGTILDEESGLVWLKDGNIRKLPMPWLGAKQYIQEMNSGKKPNFGYTDWRLPSINELQSLIDRSRFYPALAVGHPFTDVQNHFYWSSSTGRDVIDYVWIMDIASGEMTIDYLSACSYKFLWPVRSSWMPREAVSGTVMTGGLNNYGQLGDGSTNSRDALLPINGLEGTIAVASGVNHALAIKSDGSVWAWGRNNRGQLGNGKTEDSFVPVVVKDLLRVTEVAAGLYHSVALRSDGTVWAWGRNSYGQLGNGSSEDSLIPVKIKGLTNVVAIAAGMYHNVAVKSDGTVWTWGWNSFGELGDNTTKTRNEPVQVSGLPNVVSVGAGLHHSVAVKADGSVWAWGWNINGLLGDGTQETRLTPVQVKGISDIVRIASGPLHVIALKKDGTVWAWGGNEFSQLGKSTIDGSFPSKVEGIGNIKKIAAGEYHSVALMSDGTIWVWGKDLKNKAAKPTPVRIWDVSGINDIAAGEFVTLVVSGIGTK